MSDQPRANGLSALGIRELLRGAEQDLGAAGIASARHDAEALMAHCLDIERSGVTRMMVMAARLDATQRDCFSSLVARRAKREPLQHLTGRAPFRRIELRVGPGVFVPRPETELVAGAVIEAITGDRRVSGEAESGPIVVDLCSGSGAIALAIADEVPRAHVSAVELGDDAVLWLRRNVEELGLGTRVTVAHGDAGDAAAVLPGLVGRCDVVVSNPPYIPDAAHIRDPEVIDHDPALALWGGPDGLDVVRRIERQAAILLRPGGLLVLEHADLQGEAVPAILTGARNGDGGPAWEEVADHVDLGDRPRFTTARRNTVS